MDGLASRTGRLVFAALIGVAAATCAGGPGNPVVDNRTSEPVYVRVGGVVNNAATARVIVVPPMSRISLTVVRGLSEMFLTDVSVLAASDCRELAQWLIDNEEIFGDGAFEGAIVVESGGVIRHEPGDRGPAGAPAEGSDQCPPGPDILP